MSMFENFPYTDMHNLNLDWIIKIAKDFLDQYTHIQQLITDGETSLQNLTTTGLQQLDDKADEIESLLNAWYEQHSADIADQLADALQELADHLADDLQELQNNLTTTINAFNTAAAEKAAQVIEDIPADYADLANSVAYLYEILEQAVDYKNITPAGNTGGYYDDENGVIVIKAPSNPEITHWKIPVNEGDSFEVYAKGNVVVSPYVLGDTLENFLEKQTAIDDNFHSYFVTARHNGYLYVNSYQGTSAYIKRATYPKASTLEQVYNDTAYNIEMTMPWNDGYVKEQNGQITTVVSSYLHYRQIPVKSGELYRVITNTNIYVYDYYLTDANGTILEFYNDTTNIDHMKAIFVAPTTNGYLYYNTYDYNNSHIYKIVTPLDQISKKSFNAYEVGNWIAGFAAVSDGAVIIQPDLYAKHISYPVKGGEIYKLYNQTNLVIYDYIITDNNNVVVESYKTGIFRDELKDIIIKIPVNTGYLHVNSYETNYSNLKWIKSNVESENNIIMLLGDSQTQRTGYPEKFRDTDIQGKFKVVSFGQGGASALDTAYINNSIPLWVLPVAIPASTTPVQVSLLSDVKGAPLDDNTAFCVQSLQGINPCSIGGVEGTLTCSYDSGYSNKKWYFTRTTNGSIVNIERPELLKTYSSRFEKTSLVIWTGTNDMYYQTNPDEVYKKISISVDAIIAHNKSDRYFVIGMTADALMSNYQDINKLLANKYGEHFIDIAYYILRYGLSDAGITPTQQDIDYIAQGKMPPSLLDGTIHFNTAGYGVIADLIYKTGMQKGYWN